jgi:lysophospholipase L1-like esterase
MHFARLARLFGAVALIVTAACSTTPTGPTPAVLAPTIAVLQQEPPPVPPRASVTPPGALGATKFLAFGDSITYGTLASPDGHFLFDTPFQAYGLRLELALNQYHAPQRFTVVNAGLPGEWAADGALRIQGQITTHRPQVLLLLEGINDIGGGGQSVTQAAASVGRIINTARLNNVVVLVATMFQTYPREGSDNAGPLVPAFNTEIRRLATGRQNVYLVDLYAAFGNTRSLIGGDGLHPTEAGYELMATTFLTAIEQAFPVRGSFQ